MPIVVALFIGILYAVTFPMLSWEFVMGWVSFTMIFATLLILLYKLQVRREYDRPNT